MKMASFLKIEVLRGALLGKTEILVRFDNGEYNMTILGS